MLPVGIRSFADLVLLSGSESDNEASQNSSVLGLNLTKRFDERVPLSDERA